MLRALRAKTLIREIFSSEKNVKMTMRVLQENSQNVQLLMFQKTNEEKENQSRDENKIYISHDENERNFNYDDFFVYFNFKKYCNLNKKEHETKNEQIIERTSFQRIRNILSKMKKQHKSIREEKTF